MEALTLGLVIGGAFYYLIPTAIFYGLATVLMRNRIFADRYLDERWHLIGCSIVALLSSISAYALAIFFARQDYLPNHDAQNSWVFFGLPCVFAILTVPVIRRFLGEKDSDIKESIPQEGQDRQS